MCRILSYLGTPVLLEIEVSGAASPGEAEAIARRIATSTPSAPTRARPSGTPFSTHG